MCVVVVVVQCAALRNAEAYFSSLHLTDQNPVQTTFDAKKVLRFRFNLPGSEQPAAAPSAKASVATPMEALKTLTKMAIHFIDRIAITKLSAQVSVAGSAPHPPPHLSASHLHSVARVCG